MNFGEIFGYIVTFVAGGGLMTLLTAKFQRRKAAVAVKADEIKALNDQIKLVYEPMIEAQKVRIQELETEVKSLRDQLKQERADRQQEIGVMSKQIMQITSFLGMKAIEAVKNRKKNNPENTQIIG